uniref:Uncharacterized protein n=1 Tax=Spironucleus salmonicida TaxID=348837 RepID=V6LVR8_9EUKA|eukprot:EST48343.1 Hypothetical protein SS50377_11550 [Spironucleus salmonicida]
MVREFFQILRYCTKYSSIIYSKNDPVPVLGAVVAEVLQRGAGAGHRPAEQGDPAPLHSGVRADLHLAHGLGHKLLHAVLLPDAAGRRQHLFRALLHGRDLRGPLRGLHRHDLLLHLAVPARAAAPGSLDAPHVLHVRPHRLHRHRDGLRVPSGRQNVPAAHGRRQLRVPLLLQVLLRHRPPQLRAGAGDQGRSAGRPAAVGARVARCGPGGDADGELLALLLRHRVPVAQVLHRRLHLRAGGRVLAAPASPRGLLHPELLLPVRAVPESLLQPEAALPLPLDAGLAHPHQVLRGPPVRDRAADDEHGGHLPHALARIPVRGDGPADGDLHRLVRHPQRGVADRHRRLRGAHLALHGREPEQPPDGQDPHVPAAEALEDLHRLHRVRRCDLPVHVGAGAAVRQADNPVAAEGGDHSEYSAEAAVRLGRRDLRSALQLRHGVLARQDDRIRYILSGCAALSDLCLLAVAYFFGQTYDVSNIIILTRPPPRDVRHHLLGVGAPAMQGEVEVETQNQNLGHQVDDLVQEEEATPLMDLKSLAVSQSLNLNHSGNDISTKLETSDFLTGIRTSQISGGGFGVNEGVFNANSHVLGSAK